MKEMFKVAVLIPLDSNYKYELVRGIIHYAKQHGQWLLFGQNRVFHNLKNLQQWKGHGIIADIQTKREAERLSSLGLPIVDVHTDVTFEHDRLVRISNDDFQAGKDIGEHFLRRGFTNFGFVGVQQQRWSIERREGFFAALPKTVRNPHIFLRPQNYWRGTRPKKDLVKWLQDRPLSPFAVMAADDQVGAVVLEACGMAKAEVPSDVAVVGVNDDVVVCEFCNPPLSSVPFNTVETSIEAARVLQTMIEDPSRTPFNKFIQVKPQPITLRQSSSFEIGRSRAVRDAVNFIRENVGLPLSVNEVVRQCGVGRRSLEITFRKMCGHSIYDEIQRQRLKRACVLLQRSDKNITEIAFECGFNSYQRFHAQFRKQIQSTPKEFRQKYRAADTND